MDNEMNAAFQNISSPYCQPIPDHPAVNVVIQDSGVQLKKSTGNEQQKLASQRPRGTRIDDSGTRIQVKGGRNYTSRSLYISREEMFDDVVVRGLRADGLSTKLGVKNHRDGIQKLLCELFQGDSRLPIIEEHFRTHRQKSNCAKTMFATMTHEELQFLKAETFPSRIDVQVRDYLTNAFSDQPQKLQATVEVLGQVQQIFKALTPHADFLSSHNFQTRGFFLDIILMTCSFLMQIIQDSDGNPETSSNLDTASKSSNVPGKDLLPPAVYSDEKAELCVNKTAAEILLSVGSDILDSSEKVVKPSVRVQNTSEMIKQRGIENVEGGSNDTHSIPTTVVVEGSDKPEDAESEEWTTVEMVDANGNSKYVLIKTNSTEDAFDTMKILNLLQNQGLSLDDKFEVGENNDDSSEKHSVKELKIDLEKNMETALDSGIIGQDVMKPTSSNLTNEDVPLPNQGIRDDTEACKRELSCIIDTAHECSTESRILQESIKRPLQTTPRMTRKRGKLDST